MKTVGIVAHSFEGAALCFLTACREGAVHLGPHMHPNIVMSAVPMALSLPGWEANDYSAVGKFLAEGVQIVADAGADFYVCPDNTAHIVLEQIAGDLPIPGLHIADVVCHELSKHGWKHVGLLGTRWTMTGPVYENALKRHGLERLIPDEATREQLNAAIFDELCLGVFNPGTTDLFLGAIGDLKSRGAECVILGCTEIPLIVTPENSPLPTFDSTRLLAKYAILGVRDSRSVARARVRHKLRLAPGYRIKVSGIGLLNEKPLHASLKQWYARPGDQFEIPVDGFVIDIVRDNLLIEIQTRNFFAIKSKLNKLACTHRVRLIYPIVHEKWIVRSGTRGRRKSPKRGRLEDLFWELVSIPQLLSNPNFSLEVLMIRQEEVRRYEDKRRWRRKGWVIEGRQLLEVVDRCFFADSADWLRFLPDGLELFTTSDLATGIDTSRELAQKMAYCLREARIIDLIGRRGRANLYRIPGERIHVRHVIA